MSPSFERFRANVESSAATMVRVAAAGQVPDAVADYLESRGLPLVVHRSAMPPGLSAVGAGRLAFAGQKLPADGGTLVSGCLAAVADEGVIVLASGPDHAAESAFLAATHVIVVEDAQLVDSLDALWQRLRAAGPMPRMLNIVRGPSRTADLGVPPRLGAHGPLRVHIIFIGG
jgi:hypothetical protein